MTCVIPAEFREFIAQKVASGRYQSEEQLVSEALRLLREREQQLQELRREIQIGIDELRRGEGTPLDFEDIKRRGRERLAQQERLA